METKLPFREVPRSNNNNNQDSPSNPILQL